MLGFGEDFTFSVLFIFLKNGIAFQGDIKTQQQFPQEITSGFSRRYLPFTNFNISGRLWEMLIHRIPLKTQTKKLKLRYAALGIQLCMLWETLSS